MDRIDDRKLQAPRAASTQEIVRALKARDADSEVRCALALLHSPAELAELHVALHGHPDRGMVLAVGMRFLSSPVVERSVREAAQRSIRWVAKSVMPKKLTQ